MSAAVHKFLFETSFDPDDMKRAREVKARQAQEAAQAAKLAEQKMAAEPPPPPPADRFTEDDLTAAKATGYAEGEAAGRQAAQNSIDKRLAEVLSQIPQQLPGLIEAQKRADADLTKASVEIVMTIARKLLPELARRRGLAEIEAVVRACLADLMLEPRLVIRVADEMLDMVRARVDKMVADLGYEGAIVCMADPALGPADCRVDWADGGAERVSQRLWDEIDQTIGRFFTYPGDTVEIIGDVAPPRQVASPAAALAADAASDTPTPATDAPTASQS